MLVSISEWDFFFLSHEQGANRSLEMIRFVYSIVSGTDVNDIVDDDRWNCEGLDFTSVYTRHEWFCNI